MTTLPDRIGRYEVLSLLGQGGMGVLYLARDPVIDRHVALKLLKVDNDDLRRRFVREARSAGRLQHPNIVTVYDVGDHDGELFIAMEYIDGDTLATLIRDDAPFSTLRKLEMIDQLADGLGFAHNRSIIHRDIKPANLMVTRGGLLKVLDFGIARIAHREMAAASMAGGGLIGTPAYMAPEQLAGDEGDHRADIFAVGLVMYELLSGRRAFTGATTAEVLQSVMRADPVPLDTLVPHIDPDLARCVNRALAKRPEDRYQGLQELRNDIGRVRRRSEYESGSFDATIVVQVPPQPRAAPSPPPAPPPATQPAPTYAPPGSSSTAPGRTGAEFDTRAAHDEEAEALRHFATGTGRASRQVVAPANVDETMYASVTPATPVTPAATPPPSVLTSPPPRPTLAAAARVTDRLNDAEAPTVVVPIYSSGATKGPSSGPLVPPPPLPVVPRDPLVQTPLAPARRSVLPALVVLAIVVVMLVIVTIGALWWLKSVVAGRLAPVTSTEAVVDAPVAKADPPPDVVDPVSQAVPLPPEAPPAEEVPLTAAAAPAQVTAPAPQTPPASQPDLVRRPSTPPASQQALARPVSVPPTAVTPAVASPPVPAATNATEEADGRETFAPASTPAPVPRDEALVLVRAYVAARNTAHAAGIRRVWPTVSDSALRRMTGEFSAPLTLTDCDVDGLGATRMRATCRFTQPGSTVAGGTALSVRRQFVFDIARQGRGWVIVGVEG